MLPRPRRHAAKLNSRRFLMTLSFFLFAQIVAAQSSEVLSVELTPAMIAAYNRYTAATESRIESEMKRPGAFLYVEGLPAPRRSEAFKELRAGDVYMERLTTRDASGKKMTAPDAMLHHWLGAAFIPGVALPQVIHFVQDYNHHQDYYKPEIVQSRLLSRNGNDFKIFYRVRKHKVITVTLDTEHDVQYFEVDPKHWHSRSISTRIAEVVDAGEKDEHEKPVGKDGGFLWRIESWWKFEERDGGVYVECESVSLTRDIPTGLGWLIKPFVTSIPKESLVTTMTVTRDAVQKLYANKGKSSSGGN